MKNLKTLFVLMFVVGLMGISQAFACKLPGTDRLSRTVASNKVIKDFISDDSVDGYKARDLNGRYASLATATFFDPMANRTLSATCVGVVTFDGRGHFTDKEVHSYDGVIVRDEFTGTYKINSDGRGTMHFAGENEEFDYEFVVSNELKEIIFLITLEIPGVVSNGTLKKQ
jgi:hypothetical protein